MKSSLPTDRDKVFILEHDQAKQVEGNATNPECNGPVCKLIHHGLEITPHRGMLIRRLSRARVNRRFKHEYERFEQCANGEPSHQARTKASSSSMKPDCPNDEQRHKEAENSHRYANGMENYVFCIRKHFPLPRRTKENDVTSRHYAESAAVSASHCGAFE